MARHILKCNRFKDLVNGSPPRTLADIVHQFHRPPGITMATTQTVGDGTQSSVVHLARFFPAAISTRIPVRLKTLSSASSEADQQVVIEYGTATEVLFESSLALEIGDQVEMQNADGSFDARATVLAVQVEHGRRAVAARFNRQMPNWIIKP
jgi:hypothetical protein